MGRERQPPPGTVHQDGPHQQALSPSTDPTTCQAPPLQGAHRPNKHHTDGLSPKYLCKHHQPDQIGEDGDQQDEGLPAVLLAEDGRVHVHKSCDEALHADELQRAEIPPLSACPDRLPSPAAPTSAKFKPVPKGQWLLSGKEPPCPAPLPGCPVPAKQPSGRRSMPRAGRKAA